MLDRVTARRTRRVAEPVTDREPGDRGACGSRIGTSTEVLRSRSEGVLDLTYNRGEKQQGLDYDDDAQNHYRNARTHSQRPSRGFLRRPDEFPFDFGSG